VSYTPHRDYRFEYVTEAMSFVEEFQCFDCAFRGDDDEFPMMGCHFGADQLMFEEEEIEFFDDLGDAGIRCHKWRDQELVEQESPAQGRLL
jgi:hypothetical protein